MAFEDLNLKIFMKILNDLWRMLNNFHQGMATSFKYKAVDNI